MSLPREQRLELLKAAQDARKLSYSPYSKFRVGAALLLSSGKIIPGANVENASYGAGICAERTALVTYVASQGEYHKSEGKIVAVAVSSDLDAPCSPCGICRQFIREFAALDTPILMVNASWTPETDEEKDKVKVTTMTLEQLLPLSFGPEDLAKGQRA